MSESKSVPWCDLPKRPSNYNNILNTLASDMRNSDEQKQFAEQTKSPVVKPSTQVAGYEDANASQARTVNPNIVKIIRMLNHIHNMTRVRKCVDLLNEQLRGLVQKLEDVAPEEAAKLTWPNPRSESKLKKYRIVRRVKQKGVQPSQQPDLKLDLMAKSKQAEDDVIKAAIPIPNMKQLSSDEQDPTAENGKNDGKTYRNQNSS